MLHFEIVVVTSYHCSHSDTAMEQPLREKVKKFIAGYLLSNGYSQTLECFKKEADLTSAEVRPLLFDEPQKDDDPFSANDGHVGIRIDNKRIKERDCLKKVHRFPFFIVAMTLVQCGAFLAREYVPYAHTILGSPLEINPNRYEYESKCSYCNFSLFTDILDPCMQPTLFYRKEDIWRLLTYSLTHADAQHLFNNMSQQILFGLPLEFQLGSMCTFTIYIAGVLIGMVYE